MAGRRGAGESCSLERYPDGTATSSSEPNLYFIEPQLHQNLWRNAWPEFVPFLAFPPRLEEIVYTTNVIESLNARFQRACRVRGHFPNETAALKVIYPTI